MKIAHSIVITPHLAGIYESTWEIAKALRAAGHDARLVDPAPAKNPIKWSGKEDRAIPVADIAWAEEADVILSHSGVGDHFHDAKYKIVEFSHGRPRASFMSERLGKTPIYTHARNWVEKDVRYRAVVTLWPQHVPYLQYFFKKTPVYCIPSPVDLEYWKPGEAYAFGEKSGSINVLIADAWRDDLDPFIALHAFGLWARSEAGKGAKLHIVDIPEGGANERKGIMPMLDQLSADGSLGRAATRREPDELRQLYNGVDFLLTPHTIDVRTVREAMACGCPVVRVGEALDIDWVQPSADEFKAVLRQKTRAEAVTRFSSSRTAQELIDILEPLADGRISQTKHSSNG